MVFPCLSRLNILYKTLTVLEICDDVREECSKYGQILDLKVPRPSGGSRQSPGVGKIFVKFDTVESTTAALKALAGRKFSDRTVVTTYFSEVSLHVPYHVKTTLTAAKGKLRRERVVMPKGAEQKKQNETV